MRHEKIYTRGDGTRLKVIVELTTSFYDRTSVEWKISVHKCLPKKRTWRDVVNIDDYRYRRLKNEERQAYIQLIHSDNVTSDEILEAKIELWNKIKPTHNETT